jgi:hypothetical protein
VNEIRSALERAQKGDETALPLVRKALEDPVLFDLAGDLANMSRLTLIDKFSGKNQVVKEALTQKTQLLLAEVAGPTPTPLEKLLASRIVSCWLHVYHLEQIYANKDSMALELAQHYQKCIDRAHKRYLSAIKTLATVRKLALPVLQVNIARKQFNMAGPGAIIDKESGTT